MNEKNAIFIYCFLLQFPKNIVEQLNTDWPNLSGVNFEFWSYEWRQHGTCCLNNFSSAISYFNKALGIKKRNKLADVLRAGKIVPGADPIDKGLAIAEIEKTTKKKPEFVCYVDPQNRSKFYLLEIKLCLDAKGEEYIDCPRNSNCTPAKIYWPNEI